MDFRNPGIQTVLRYLALLSVHQHWLVTGYMKYRNSALANTSILYTTQDHPWKEPSKWQHCKTFVYNMFAFLKVVKVKREFSRVIFLGFVTIFSYLSFLIDLTKWTYLKKNKPPCFSQKWRESILKAYFSKWPPTPYWKPEKVISFEPDWPKGHRKCYFLLIWASQI